MNFGLKTHYYIELRIRKIRTAKILWNNPKFGSTVLGLTVFYFIKILRRLLIPFLKFIAKTLPFLGKKRKYCILPMVFTVWLHIFGARFTSAHSLVSTFLFPVRACVAGRVFAGGCCLGARCSDNRHRDHHPTHVIITLHFTANTRYPTGF